MKWEGVMPAVTTKFTNNDELDFEMFNKNIVTQVLLLYNSGQLFRENSLSDNCCQITGSKML